MAKICAIVLNSVTRDARVVKEAATLVQAGHDVTVVGVMDRDIRQPQEQLANGVQIVRVDLGALLRGYRQLALSARYLVGAILLFAAIWLPLERQLDLIILGLSLTLFVLFIRQLKPIHRTVRAFVRNQSGDQSGDLARSSFVMRLREHLQPLAMFHFLARSIFIYQAVRQIEPDVVHCHDVHTLGVGALAKRRLGCKVVYDAHEIYEEVAQVTSATAQRYGYIHRRYLRHVDAFVTINESIARWYAEHYPKLPPAVVVMNAVHPAPPFVYDGRLHQAAGLEGGEKILLYQGGFARMRGLDHLVRAAEQLPRDWTLVMMGWGKEEAALRRVALEVEARTPHRPSPVRFIPPAPQSELVMWTAGATVGVIPYENVGLNHWFCTPNKLWEYPNAGVPVLVSPFPELRRQVEAYGFGWLLPESLDPHLLAAQLSNLRETDLTAAREGCRRFIQHENWEKYGRRLVALYDALLEVRRPDERSSMSPVETELSTVP